MTNFEKWSESVDVKYLTVETAAAEQVGEKCQHCPAWEYCDRHFCGCAETFTEWARKEADE